MDVRLSAEQEALRDAAAQLADRLCPKAVGELDDAERAAKLDAAVEGAGWRDLRGADESGRPWASAVEVALVAEELGRGLADTSFIGPTLAAELRRLAGAPPSDQRETVVLDTKLGALAPIDLAAGVAIDAAGCTAALLVRSDGTLAAADCSAPPTAEPIDLTRPTVPVDATTPTQAIDGAALSDDASTRWVALGLALTCADLVGVMRGAVALAAEYVAERRQYGVPVGSFQAVQHLLADALVATEGSRSVTLHAAWSVDALEPRDALAAGAVAKAYCARSARSVCETVIQAHGGIGNTWECLAHVYLRRALVSSDMFGGVGRNLSRVLEHAGINA